MKKLSFISSVLLAFSFLLLAFFSCCPEITQSEKIESDSVYIEKIIRDSIYIKSLPEVEIIEYSKTFTINPFEARTDTIVFAKGKEYSINYWFKMTAKDSVLAGLDFEENTGDISRTITKTELKTIHKVIHDEIPWYEYILWICTGILIGIFLTLTMIWKKI